MAIPITSPPADPVLDELGARFNIFEIETVIIGAAVWIFVIAGIAMFICIFLTGFQLTAGNPDKGAMQSARNRLTNCLIGLSIVALAWAVILLVQYFFGLEIFGE